MIKNSQPFGKKFQKTVGGGIFFWLTLYICYLCACCHITDDRYPDKIVRILENMYHKIFDAVRLGGDVMAENMTVIEETGADND